jgi:hypothetical protein
MQGHHCYSDPSPMTRLKVEIGVVEVSSHCRVGLDEHLEATVQQEA